MFTLSMDLFRPTSREFKHFNSIENAVIPHSLPETLPSKEDAISWIKNFDASRLDKSYTCYLFTDKQFSLAKAENGFAIPYTTKQRNTPYTLGK